MFAFILKFFLQDIFYEERDRNSTDRILNQVPQVSMSRVQLPVHFVDVTSEPGSNPVIFLPINDYCHLISNWFDQGFHFLYPAVPWPCASFVDYYNLLVN